MKKLFIFSALAVTFGGIFNSCDYVSNAVPTVQNTSTSGGSTGTVYRKVLVEDYTGHKCGNCPAAARELRKLDSIYSGKIIPLAVHAGFYATINSQYPTDLRSQAGTDYDNFFGNSIAGNPNGMVNRTGYGTSNLIKQWSDWGSAAYAFFPIPADFKIEISNAYNAGTNQVTSTIITKMLNAVNGTYNLVVLMTEDSIVAEQIDYSITSGSQLIPNYEFNHVLRGSMNSSWGSQLINGSKLAGDSLVTTISNFQLASNWKWKYCHVVAFIYDAVSGSPTQYEVLQVEMKELN